MREIGLWHRLLGADASPEAIAAVAELARADFDRRATVLPALGPWLDASDAPRRALAVRMLGGCTGMLALRRLVEALDDAEQVVRDAAVDALAQTCVAQPMRWAHALFHARADVRRRAAACTPEAARVLLAWCWADPQLAPWCEDAPWPTQPVALIHDLWRRGRIPAAAALGGLSQCTAEALREFAARAEARGPAGCAAFVAAAVGAIQCPPAPGDDCLEAWIEIVGVAGAAGKALLGVLVDVMHTPAVPELRARMLVAVCVAAERHGWSPPLGRLAFEANPRWIAFEFVPVALRAATLERVWSPGGTLELPPAALVEDAMCGPLGCDDLGAPSLSRLAALAALLPSRRVRTIVDVLSESRAVELAAADPAGWHAVSRLPPETAHLWWLDRIADVHPARAPLCRALLCVRWASAGDGRALAADGPLMADLRGLVDGLIEADDIEGLGLASVDVERVVAAIEAAFGAQLAELCLPSALAVAPRQGVAAKLLGLALQRDAVAFARRVAAAGDAALDAALGWLDEVLAPGAAAVGGLTHGWRDVGHPRVAAFVERVLRPSAPPPPERMPVVGPRRVGAAEADRIASCEPEALAEAVAGALSAPSFGLTEALAARVHAGPDLAVAAALVGCVDGLVPVARELARFATTEEAFVEDLRHACVTLWRESDAVPPLVDAILVAFERNAAGLATWFESEDGGYTRVLQDSLDLPSVLATTLVWEAIAEVLTVWSWRDGPRRIAAGFAPGLVATCVNHLDTQLGPAAARILVALWRARVAVAALERVRPRVIGLGPACTRRTHHALGAWISLRGIAARDSPGRPLVRTLPPDEGYELRRSTDVVRLGRACEIGGERTARDAVLRLVELGEPGQVALAQRLGTAMRHPDLAIDSIGEWTSPTALAIARSWIERRELAIALRFRIAVALARRGGLGEVLAALAVAAEPGAHQVARSDDWPALLDRVENPRACVEAAAMAVDPILADAAISWLIACPAAWVTRALAVAIDGAGGASEPLRRAAAVDLLRRGDAGAAALVLRWLLDIEPPLLADQEAMVHQLAAADVPWADAIVDLCLLGGMSVASEARVVNLLMLAPAEARDRGCARILVDGCDPATRKRIVAGRLDAPGRDAKLMALASTFAWGVMRGRELTGKIFSIHMTPKREQWGFTHLEGTAVHVTPVPILARVRHGRDIVEGLILHEIGHHVWHAGKPAARVWRRAQKEHLHPLLNLVADEHLERNLRSIDAEFGDRIKRLDAHAFQHAAREIEVLELLEMLRGGAVEVLGGIAPQPAYGPTCLRIDSGALLSRLDAAGHSFARFVRALRMGLGNRSGDAKVDAALGHFGAGFRHLDMHGLYRVTRELAALFGSETLLAHGFGGHESVGWNERDADITSDGIRDTDVQREVERILEPPRANPGAAGGGRLAINVGAGDAYKKITKVQPVAPDAARHAALASTVGRHASRLRETLERLGLGHRATRGRLRGHAIDRSRVRAVVTRGDPRMLQARELQVYSDLFLGVVVDCSGSMSGANLDRARRFAVLVAQAARGLVGVDARFFGFTDTVIWDAGDARRCAVASLEASGGNNDAAALDHVANVAARSRRRAKLVVMISDGLPTECSVSALRAVVRDLTRRHHMCCAQVAVRPLSEICFPNYVLLDDANLDAAVRRFAELIARLIGRALAM